MKIGLTEVTSGKSGIELLEHAASLGLSGIEPMLGTIDSPYFAWLEDDFREFHKKSRQLEITAPSTAVSIFNEFPGLVELDHKNRAIDIINKSLTFSAKAGARLMLLCTFFASKPDSPEKEVCFLEILKEVVPKAEEMNVKIGVESPLNISKLIEHVERIDSEYLGVYYDTGNSIFLGRDPSEEIMQLGNKIVGVHFKDSINDLGDAHLGSGKLDTHLCLDALKSVNYNGWIMLETPRGNDKKLFSDINILNG